MYIWSVLSVALRASLRQAVGGRRCWTMYPAALDLPYVLWEREDINSILYRPINSTQRIKYTCFNASSNYILLGSTSGSIYVFSREPCSFLYIIPLSEGVISRIAISPDEKNVALATARGTVSVVSLKSTPQLIAISMGHLYEQITCLCWNNNSTDIYVGDAAGKVSVIVLSIFAVKGMFQTPICILMNLDSSIVQLDFFSPLLLVSTLSRCYICETVQEQYKHIGNKPRSGEFGACFYKVHENTALNLQKEERNINDVTHNAFNLISDNDSNILGEKNHTKIFCARPGSRLWEVSADGTVVNTHQFKEALAIPPTTILRSSLLDFSHKEEIERGWPSQSINFSHLFVIARRYLFSYTNSGMYIIDPINESVLMWSNEYTNIAMAAVVDDRIYLMTCDSEFHCLALSSLDSLILRLYRHERYSECINACYVYRSQLSRLSDIKETVEMFEMEEDLPRVSQDAKAMLRPLITLLQAGSNNRPAKLDSGIVIVHSENGGFTKRTYDCETISALQSPETSNEDENLAREETTSTDLLDLDEDNCEKLDDSQQNVMHRMQSDLQLVYDLANSVRPNMSEKEIEEIISETDKLMKTIKEFYKSSSGLQSFIYEVTRAAELHCYNTFLENASVELLHSISNDLIMRQFTRAFIQINSPAYARCSCGYPYPIEKSVEPKFLAIGESLIRRYADADLPKECSNICDQVPYMWRVYLAICIERRNTLDDLLRQCLQTRDKVVLSFLLPALNEQQWSCVDTCLSEIEEGTCLFCAMPLTEKPDYNVLVDWSAIAGEIMKREGPDQATAFLIKLENMMPNVNFDRSIFQSIVFTKMLHRRGLKKSIDFSKTNQLSEFGTICSSQVREQLAKSLEKDLRRPINENVFGSGAHHWGMRHQAKSSTCPCCTLSLQTPILLGDSGIAIFRCGHAYHVNCMIERKLTRCNLH